MGDGSGARPRAELLPRRRGDAISQPFVPPPTHASLLRGLLQALQGLLELHATSSTITVPRSYLVQWRHQVQTLLNMLEEP